MPKTQQNQVAWQGDIEDHCFPAAQSYLSLIYSATKASKLVRQLQRARVSEFKAKDIFRASGLSLLGVSNLHVERDRRKILKGKALSPLLLVRDPDNGKVIIADGYHRMCAIYGFDEDAIIRCKIV